MLAQTLRRNRQVLSPLLNATWPGDASGASCSGRRDNESCSLPSFSGRYFRRHLSGNAGGGEPERIEDAWARNPQQAATELASKLSPAQRAVLASALAEHTAVQQLDDTYWEELFKVHDRAGDSNLNRSEFQAAMLAHTSLTETRNRTPPTPAAIKMVFLASAIPFVGFGFLDNAIMLVAGEEIDHLLGIKLGLSTLASAGLGNAVADVIGVGAAKYIEQVVRLVPFVREPKLSKHQHQSAAVQRAKLAGAMIGVLIGCLLGLLPLFLSGSFFTVR